MNHAFYLSDTELTAAAVLAVMLAVLAMLSVYSIYKSYKQERGEIDVRHRPAKQNADL